MIFYEYRRDVELLLTHRFSKFKSFRAKIIVITSENIQDFYNFNDDKNEYNFNDNDD